MKRIRRILRKPEAAHSAISPFIYCGILLVLATILVGAWRTSTVAAQVAIRKTGPVSNAPSPYNNWLDQDVAYIITDAERAEFRTLSSQPAFESFVERFWHHRDKEEHYRRIAYSNANFGSSVPGWKTQRGETYIKYGPPSTVERHDNFETWKYANVSSLGGRAKFVFMDERHTGDYQLKTIDVKPAALHHSTLGETLMAWHNNAFRFVHSLFHWSH